jgi:hypothetical protein
MGWVRPKVSPRPADGKYEEEVTMHTNPIHSTPAAQNEAAVKAGPRQNAAPQRASVPQDKVTLSPPAKAQVQAHANAQKPASAGKKHDGGRK